MKRRRRLQLSGDAEAGITPLIVYRYGRCGRRASIRRKARHGPSRFTFLCERCSRRSPDLDALG